MRDWVCSGKANQQTYLQRVVHEDGELERDGARTADDRARRVVNVDVVDVDTIDKRRRLAARLFRYLRAN